MNARATFLTVSAVGLLLATASCRREERKAPPPPPRTELAPLAVPAPSFPLAVPGHGDAIVAAPSGVTVPAPVVIAVLGIGDTPESQCGTWRELVGQRAFVLCPRGMPHFVREEPASPAEPGEDDAAETATSGAGMDPQADAGKLVQVGFYHRDIGTLETEVNAGLTALRARFGAYVAGGPVLYTGFSRGAFLGASLVAKDPAMFRRAILVEGGQSAWNDESAAAFAKTGGTRVLFACGRPSCVSEAEAAAAILVKHHVATRIVHGQGEGHGYKKQVKEQIRESFDWVVEGDPLWRQLYAGPP
ncbi:MAG: uncharacterized protein JWP87_4370 [Labilithrix sp.]|nr:uncharacterized protein [Labilithrix sp.]